MKITIKEFLRDLNYHYINMGCYYFGSTNNNRILFDDDEEGNGTKPYLYLKFYKTFAKFTGGLELRKSEKNIKFEFKNYKKLEKFTDDVGDFTRKYFKSFELKRK